MKNIQEARIINASDSKIGFLEDALMTLARFIARAEKEGWDWLHACFSVMAMLIAQQMKEELTKTNRRN